MKDRIKQIMDNERMTSTEFADRLQVSRAVISHILNGRNNPSLDVVTKILQEMPYIDSEWLINEKGKMYKADYEPNHQFEKQDLFSQDGNIQKDDARLNEKMPGNRVNLSEMETKSPEHKIIMSSPKQAKKISQIIIYYDDNTFEKFTPESR